MAAYKLLLLPGDGIGPEVMAEVERVVAWVNARGHAKIETETDLSAAAPTMPMARRSPTRPWRSALQADAVMLGAVGGPKWDGVAYDQRPEAGLLRLRKDLELFANLRPAICYPALADASSLKRDRVDGLDIMIVRELTGGVYFGEPKEIKDLGNGQKRAVDTQVYETYEIERIAAVAFELARLRRNQVHSAEKRNVMKTGVLWNEVVTRLHKERYSDVTLHHILADNCAMQLVRSPKQFDVIVTDNLFGDMLSDEAADARRARSACCRRPRLAPPMRTVAAARSTSRCTAQPPTLPGAASPTRSPPSRASPWRFAIPSIWAATADRIESAIAFVLDEGYRTADIAQDGCRTIGTAEMGKAIVAALDRMAE